MLRKIYIFRINVDVAYNAIFTHTFHMPLKKGDQNIISWSASGNIISEPFEVFISFLNYYKMFNIYLCPLDPEHQRALGNLKYFDYQLAKQNKAEKEQSPKEESKKEQEKEVGKMEYLPEKRKYEKLCRGEGLRMVIINIL